MKNVFLILEITSLLTYSTILAKSLSSFKSKFSHIFFPFKKINKVT